MTNRCNGKCKYCYQDSLNDSNDFVRKVKYENNNNSLRWNDISHNSNNSFWRGRNYFFHGNGTLRNIHYDVVVWTGMSGQKDSLNDSNDYEAVEKLTKFFSSMTENQKPFQIAYGGGEPTLHYQFHDIMKLTREFGISPNYTTNGMFIESPDCEKIIETTKKYCEGIAITCHKHLKKYWIKAAKRMISENIFTNFHNLISDRKSVNEFLKIYKEWSGKVKYFVVLPMIEHGRAKNVKTDFDYFFKKIIEVKNEKGNINDIAFGANFFPYLKKYKEIEVSLYEPEIMSKYLSLKDMAVYKSSFKTDKVLKYINV